MPFTVRAFRSISGRVLSYDLIAGRYIPVANVQVVERELSLVAVTDVTGRYLFRNLAAGTYIISVSNEAQTSTHTLRLGAEPVDLTNMDFRINSSVPRQNSDLQ
jgi:hypothetical protein